MGALTMFCLIAVPASLAALARDYRHRHGLDLDDSDRAFARKHRIRW